MDVSSALGALVAGTNLLAVHALNHSAGASRFLVLPALRATFRTSALGYLSEPTPELKNGGRVSALDAWRVEYFTPEERQDEAVSGLFADPDLDGWPNGIEFSSVTDPRVGTAGTPGVFTMEQYEGGDTDPSLTVRFRFRLGADEIEPLVDVSSNLVSWHSGAPLHTVPVGGPVYGHDGSETFTVRDAESGSRRFMRVGTRFN